MKAKIYFPSGRTETVEVSHTMSTILALFAAGRTDELQCVLKRTNKALAKKRKEVK